MTDPLKNSSDAELIELCKEGSDRAWTALIERYKRLVYSIPARNNLPEHLCDEVFQTVWAITVKHLGQIRDPQSLPAWLIRTTQRETWRVARAAREQGQAVPEVAAWADPDEGELLEQRQHMRDALELLDERCRTLLLALFRTDRPDYDVIARQTGMPRGSIGPSRGRCLEKLRSLIEKHTGRPAG